MIGNAPQSPITGVPGWETQAEQELLTKYAALAPKGSVIAEIGGEFGMSASLFAHAARPSVQIFTVDLFPGDLLDKHVSNLAEAGFAGRTEPIRDNSHVLANARTQSLVDNGYWLLFVDGDHSYEGVAADISGWANSVWEGGYLIFHDVAQATNKMPHLLHFEVTRAISEWLNGQSDFEAVEQVDTTAVFRRVKKTSAGTQNKEYKKGFDYPVDNGLVTYAQPGGTEQPESVSAPEEAKDRWYSTDGQNWQNDARPGESIDSDPHPNLTGQVVLDDKGNVVAQARSIGVLDEPAKAKGGKSKKR